MIKYYYCWIPPGSVSCRSYSDMLGLHSLKAARLVYCTLLYVLSLALAASAHLSPPLLQLNMSAPRWQTAPGYSHWSPFLSVAIVFCYFSEYQGVFSKLASIFLISCTSECLYLYLSHAFLSLIILVGFFSIYSFHGLLARERYIMPERLHE